MTVVFKGCCHRHFFHSFRLEACVNQTRIDDKKKKSFPGRKGKMCGHILESFTNL
jgi:hypothetical protein